MLQTCIELCLELICVIMTWAVPWALSIFFTHTGGTRDTETTSGTQRQHQGHRDNIRRPHLQRASAQFLCPQVWTSSNFDSISRCSSLAVWSDLEIRVAWSTTFFLCEPTHLFLVSSASCFFCSARCGYRLFPSFCSGAPWTLRHIYRDVTSPYFRVSHPLRLFACFVCRHVFIQL
jgi:hypothetical protein